MNYLLVSDIHLGFGENKVVKEKLNEMLEFSSDESDCLICMGDLIGTEKDDQLGKIDEDKKNIRTVTNILNRFEGDVKYIPGNHEKYNLNEKSLYKDLGYSGDELYNNIALLDTSFQNRVCGKLDLDFLESLSSSDVETVISHHPYVLYSVENNDWFNRNPEMVYCANRNWGVELVESLNPSLILNAHLHRRRIVNKKNLCPAYTVSPFNRKHLNSDETHGYFSHLSDNKIKEYRITDDFDVEKILELNYRNMHY